MNKIDDDIKIIEGFLRIVGFYNYQKINDAWERIKEASLQNKETEIDYGDPSFDE